MEQAVQKLARQIDSLAELILRLHPELMPGNVLQFSAGRQPRREEERESERSIPPR